MFGLFKKKTSSFRPRAVVFVDFEHWLIALSNQHHCRPDYKTWLKDLHSRVEPEEIVFFGDFSHPNLAREIPKIREFTNQIIETRNPDKKSEKDFTDFIMLDAIYQKAVYNKDADTFVLFTGDSHFSSAVSFLVNRCKKQVGVYGVKNSFARQLVNTASWSVEVGPSEPETVGREYDEFLFSSIANASDKYHKGVKPTFAKTIKVVAEYHNLPEEDVKKSLERLIREGVIIRERTGSEKPNDTLVINSKKAEKNPLFVPYLKKNEKKIAAKAVKKSAEPKKSAQTAKKTKPKSEPKSETPAAEPKNTASASSSASGTKKRRRRSRSHRGKGKQNAGSGENGNEKQNENAKERKAE